MQKQDKKEHVRKLMVKDAVSCCEKSPDQLLSGTDSESF